MFILTTISDLVQIDPEDFQKPSAEAIEDNINAKYANKVIQKIGLCICLYDILKASDGLIGHGTGIANVNVEFRLIVFRPFKGEIITGQIENSTDAGVKSFFDDIWVPGRLLHDGSKLYVWCKPPPIPLLATNVEEQVWVWQDDYYYDKQDWVRLRVEEETWHDLSPVAPADREAVANGERKSPYQITASMNDPGLGSVQWW